MLTNQVEKLAEIRARHESILARLGQLLSFARSFKDKGKNRPFQSMKIEGYDYSLLDAILFAERTIRIFRAIKFNKNTPISFSSLDQVANFTVTLDGTLNELIVQSESISNNTLEVEALSGSRLQITASGEILADIADMTQRTVNATDQLLVGVGAIAGVVGVSAGNDQAAELVKDETAEVIAALSQVEGATKETQELLERVQVAAMRVDQLKAELETKLAEATSQTTAEIATLNATVAGVGDYSTKASNDAAVAASKREEMDRLTAQAQDAYKALSGFQATLDSTQKNLASAYDRAEKMTVDFEVQRGGIADMIAQAEKMVSSSTVAGLAEAFDQERKSLDVGVKDAFFWFRIGIGLLFLTSVLVAAYILNITIPWLEWLTKRATAEPSLAQVVSRAVIVIAPFWLTLFSARRYRSLFDLRQQYSHKYNMAFSMQGFKTQAPSFAENIAAWVFTIVAANPVLPSAGKSMDTPPPMTVQGMMKEVREMYEKVMGKEAV